MIEADRLVSGENTSETTREDDIIDRAIRPKTVG